MRKNSLLYTSLLFSMILAVLEFYALKYHFYWAYWWFDIFMHFFTGFILGLFIYWVLFNSKIFGNGDTLKKSTRIIIVFVCVMVLGLLWEWMEILFDLTDSTEGYPLDPIIDLFLDGVGGVLATLVSLKKAHNSTASKLNG